MPSMRVMRLVELDGVARDAIVTVTASVKELTVGEIRAWLKDSGMVSGDLVDCALFESFSLPDLCIMSTLTPDDIDLLPPSEIRRLEGICREVNADFFEMRSRVVMLGKQALAAG